MCSFGSYFLLFLSQPPQQMPEAAYFFLLPTFLWFLSKPSSFKVLIAFLISGWVYNIVLVGWMRHVSFGGMFLATLLMSFYQIPWFLLASKWVPMAVKRNFFGRMSAIFGLASFWVLLEWSRCQFTLGFPWCPLSASQWERPAILQAVPYVGAWGVSFFLLVFNLCLASYLHHLLIRRRKKQSTFKSFCPDLYIGMSVFLLMLLPLLVIAPKDDDFAKDRRISVGICQPYLMQKWEQNAVQLHKSSLIRQTKFLGILDPDLIVWPEASTPYALNLDRLWVEELSKQVDTPLLVGAVIKEDEASYNAVSLVSPSRGLNPEFYAKQILVPFGEYVPFPFNWIPGLRKLVGPVGDFKAGESSFVFEIRYGEKDSQKMRIGSLICYEDIFPRLSREVALRDLDFLFVTTNDSWFGEEGCAEQHAAHSILRALEIGIPVLRCGNAGWSGLIDKTGRVRKVLTDDSGSIYFEGGSTVELHMESAAKTTYLSHGDYFVVICFFVFALSWLMSRIRMEKSVVS